jgi:hypothetical protein
MKKIIKLNERDLTRIIKRVIKEQTDMIHIPTHYGGVRMELGLEDSDDANSDDIISLYNEIVEEGTPLVSYSEYGTEGKFYNEDDDEIPTDVILDELNYAIVGGKDEDEDYGPPAGKTGRVSDNEYVLSDSGISKYKFIFNPKQNRYEFKNWGINGSQGTSVLTDDRLESLLDFLTKHK